MPAFKGLIVPPNQAFWNVINLNTSLKRLVESAFIKIATALAVPKVPDVAVRYQHFEKISLQPKLDTRCYLSLKAHCPQE